MLIAVAIKEIVTVEAIEKRLLQVLSECGTRTRKPRLKTC